MVDFLYSLLCWPFAIASVVYLCPIQTCTHFGTNQRKIHEFHLLSNFKVRFGDFSSMLKLNEQFILRNNHKNTSNFNRVLCKVALVPQISSCFTFRSWNLKFILLCLPKLSQPYLVFCFFYSINAVLKLTT